MKKKKKKKKKNTKNKTQKNNNKKTNKQTNKKEKRQLKTRNSSRSCHMSNWAASWQNQQNDCAPSEDSDQPGHPSSQIRFFAVRSAKDPSFLHADSEDSESSLGAHVIFFLVLSWGGSI